MWKKLTKVVEDKATDTQCVLSVRLLHNAGDLFVLLAADVDTSEDNVGMQHILCRFGWTVEGTQHGLQQQNIVTKLLIK